MNESEQWYQNNLVQLNTLSRRDLAEAAYDAAIKNQQPPPTLFHGDREITKYELKASTTFENQHGFDLTEISQKQDLQEFTPAQLQEFLNTNQIINVGEWLNALCDEPCVIELSRGDIIDFSNLSHEPDTGLKCDRALLAIIETNINSITIYEVIEHE